MYVCVCVCFLTLLATQQPLDALDEFVSVTIGVDADLFQLLVTHVCQHIQRYLPKTTMKSCVSPAHGGVCCQKDVGEITLDDHFVQ